MRSNFMISRRGLLAGLAIMPVLPGPLFAQMPELPLVTMTKDPFCGCCSAWAEHLEVAGFPVRVVETGELHVVKQRLGVPAELASCHTAEIGGYVLEGHVPAPAVRRLLAKQPSATGLAVPGMPAGSPGMDYPGVTPEPYEVVLFDHSEQAIFARFLGTQEL